MKKANKNDEFTLFEQVSAELENHKNALNVIFNRILENEQTKDTVESLICTTVSLVFAQQAKSNKKLLDSMMRCYTEEQNKIKSEEK